MDAKTFFKSFILLTIAVFLWNGCSIKKVQPGETIFDTYSFKFLTSDDELLELTQEQIIAFMKNEIGNEPRDFNLVHFKILQNPDDKSEYTLLGVSDNGFVNIVASLEKQSYGFKLTGSTCECKSETVPACDSEIWSGKCACTPCNVSNTKTSTVKTVSTEEFKTVSRPKIEKACQKYL